MNLSVLFLLGAPALAAVVDLDARESRQLASTVDFTFGFDEGALYPLLRNALTWPADPGPGGSINPDYQAIIADPGSSRGRLYLIEGRLARSRPVQGLARPGAWDGRLKQWVILVRQGSLNEPPAQRDDEVAVVLLVDPPPDPAPQRRVQVLARFYKVMKDRDLYGRESDFMVFVGRTGNVVRAGAGGHGPGLLSTTLLLLVIALTAAYMFLRRSVGRRAFATRSAPEVARKAMDEGHELEEPGLPDDPVKALDELRRRR
jgi:hypothetical protein